MKYVSIDQLHDFEFHDSVWSFVSWENDNLTVKIRMLNIHKDAEQNGSAEDMEIKEATVTFTGIKHAMYTLPRTWYKDEKGNSVTNDPLVIYENGEAVERFIAALKQEDRAECMFFDKKDEKYEFGGIGREWISFEFGFAGVTVEWDEFDGKAWYVRERKQ